MPPNPNDAEASVILLDTIGELPATYSLATWFSSVAVLSIEVVTTYSNLRQQARQS